jgi:hypothetical protein
MRVDFDQLHLCCCRTTPENGSAGLSGDIFMDSSISTAWEPFTSPIESAGLPKRNFRAPMLAKLRGAGFCSLLDVRALEQDALVLDAPLKGRKQK